MNNLLCKKRVFSIPQYLKYEKMGIGKKVIYDIAKDLEEQGFVLNKNSKLFNVASVTLGLILYSEKVLAASDVIPVEPGFWKLIGIIQKIVAGLALLYSYRVLAKMAAKGEGTWKEVGYGLLITAADYGLPAAFKFVASLF
jgi:hypothetical protein